MERLVLDLPPGWDQNLQELYIGRSLILFTLSRLNLLRTKLYALADRGIDLEDCIAMAPIKEELDVCKEWVLLGDANPMWPKHIDDVFKDLSKRLGYEE